MSNSSLSFSSQDSLAFCPSIAFIASLLLFGRNNQVKQAKLFIPGCSLKVLLLRHDKADSFLLFSLAWQIFFQLNIFSQFLFVLLVSASVLLLIEKTEASHGR